MRKLIIILFLLIFAEPLYGQGFQVGMRAGVGIMVPLTRSNNEGLPNDPNYEQTNSFEKELFLHYQINRWAFEAGLNVYNHKSIHTGRYEYFEWGPNKVVETKKANLYLYTVKALFNMSPETLSEKGYDLFIGINMGTVAEYSKSENLKYYTENDAELVKSRIQLDDFKVIAGLSLGTTIKLSPKIHTSYLLEYNYNVLQCTYGLYNPVYDNSHLSARIGIAYSIK